MATSIPKSIRATLYIDGKPAEGTMKNLETVTGKLNRELKQLEVGTEAWNRKMKEVKSHQKALQGLRDEVKGTAGAFGFLKTEIGKIGALAVGYLGFQFVTDQFRNIIMSNAELSDSIADVRKTTGLSEVAVRRLNAEFKKIDTRSSRAELNGLARIAGKLGISAEEDVLGFVRAADKISVALGEDLGGSEEAINKLGKLVEIFKLKDELGLEQALLNVGSAINELGAAGTANEGYIVEFTKRLAGIAPAANMSIQDVMGLGAVMDELGQPVESSATAIGQFIVGLGQDIPKFAKIAGMSVKDFSAVLQADGNKALIAVLKNVNSTGAGVAGLAANMGMLGEDGARAIQALGSLSGNLKLLETRQNLANAEFSKGLSLTEEFNVKNNTFGATIDKLKKKIGQLTSNFAFQDFLLKVTLLFSNGIDFINENTEAIGRWIKIIVVAGAAIITYRTYLMLANSAKLQFIVTILRGEKAMVLSRTATIALSGVKALLTGNLTKAAQAWRLLNVTMAANPIGAIIAAVVAIGFALTMFNSKLGIAAQAQKNLIDINKEAETATNREKLAIDRLLKTLGTENASKEQKLAAVTELRNMMPDVLQAYTDEEIMAGRATVAIKEQAAAIVSRAKARAIENKITALEDQKINIQSDIAAGPGEMEKLLMGFNKTVTFGIWDPLEGWFSKRAGEIEEVNAQQKDLEDNLSKLTTAPVAKVDGTVPTPPIIGGLSKEQIKEQNKAKEDARRAAEKLTEDLKKLSEDLFKDQLTKNDAEIENARLKYTKLREDAAGNKDKLVAIANLEAQEVTAIYARQAEAQKKINDEQARDKADFAQKIFEMGLSDEGKLQAENDRKYEALILEADRLGLDSTSLYRFWEDEKLRITQEANKKQLSEQDRRNKESYDKDKKNIDDRAELAHLMVDSIGSVLSLVAGSQAEFANYQKVITGIQIAIDTAAAISAATKSGAYVGLTPIEKAIAIAGNIAVVLASMAKAKQLLSKTPNAPTPQFAQGGFSNEDPEGFVNNDTVFNRSASGRPFRAGEAGREWIAPNWMLENPRTANIIGMLETARKTRGFAVGGSTGPAVTVNSNMDISELTQMMAAFIDAQNRTNNRVPVLIKKDLDDINSDERRIRIDLDA